MLNTRMNNLYVEGFDNIIITEMINMLCHEDLTNFNSFLLFFYLNFKKLHKKQEKVRIWKMYLKFVKKGVNKNLNIYEQLTSLTSSEIVGPIGRYFF